MVKFAYRSPRRANRAYVTYSYSSSLAVKIRSISAKIASFICLFSDSLMGFIEKSSRISISRALANNISIFNEGKRLIESSKTMVSVQIQAPVLKDRLIIVILASFE